MRFLMVLAVLLSACSSPTAAPASAPDDAQPATVSRHVDGDTIWVRVDVEGAIPRGEHKVRLLEIDTPEVGGGGRVAECLGEEAAAFMAQQLPLGEQVGLVADREGVDRYGRFLRYVWASDGTFVNAEAVRQGFARAVLYEPNDRYIEQLRGLEREARGHGRGLWSACPAGR